MKIDLSLTVIFAAFAFVCSWIYRGYLYGKKEQTLESEVENLKKELDKNAVELQQTRSEVKANFDKMMDIFYDDETKSNRFLTNNDHNLFCTKNTELILLPIKTLTETVGKLNNTVEELTKNLGNVEKTIAVIESIRKDGGMRYYDFPKREIN